MKAVLYHGIEIVCGRRVLVLVNTALCIYIGNLLPNTPFTGTDGKMCIRDRYKALKEELPTAHSWDDLKDALADREDVYKRQDKG